MNIERLQEELKSIEHDDQNLVVQVNALSASLNEMQQRRIQLFGAHQRLTSLIAEEQGNSQTVTAELPQEQEDEAEPAKDTAANAAEHQQEPQDEPQEAGEEVR